MKQEKDHKKLKVKEVVQYYLDRIKKYNPSLNAIVSKKNRIVISSRFHRWHHTGDSRHRSLQLCQPVAVETKT